MIFTPGIWEFFDANEGEYRPLYCVANYEYHNPTNEDAPCLYLEIHHGCKEDALLISAAKELFEACCEALIALDWEDLYQETGITLEERMDVLRKKVTAAIAKAEGKT